MLICVFTSIIRTHPTTPNVIHPIVSYQSLYLQSQIIRNCLGPVQQHDQYLNIPANANAYANYSNTRNYEINCTFSGGSLYRSHSEIIFQTTPARTFKCLERGVFNESHSILFPFNSYTYSDCTGYCIGIPCVKRNRNDSP